MYLVKVYWFLALRAFRCSSTATFLLLLLAHLSLTACVLQPRPREVELPFKTIYVETGSTTFRSPRPVPALFVIPNLERVEALRLGDARVDDSTDELEAVLLAVDYDTNFVIVVFGTSQSVASPLWEVLRVTRRADTVTVEAKPPPPLRDGETMLDMGTIPYTVITVPREGEWAREIRFILEVDGQQVHEHQALIP